MRLSPRIAIAVLAAGVVALAAGCGGGGKKTPATSTSNSGGTTTQTSGGSTSFASAKNCREFSGLAAKIASAMATTASKNPATELDTEAKQLQALANAAPAEIRGDFQTFATTFAGYLHALEQAGFKPGQSLTSPPSAAQIAKLTEAAKVFSSAKLTAAEAHLSAWAAANCK